MSIKTIVSNVENSFQSTIGNSASTVANMFQNAIGEATATFSTLWDGGFVGLNKNNFSELENQVNTLMNEIEGVIAEFNAEAEFETGIKGTSASAATEYVRAVSELLRAYVSTYRNFLKLANESIMAMDEGDAANAAAIREATAEIQDRAKEIRVD